jgi:hypothetical protein
LRYLIAALLLASGLLQTEQAASRQPGQLDVPPQSAWSCPLTHPIKGNFTTYSGEPCIYHVPGGYFYGQEQARALLPERAGGGA